VDTPIRPAGPPQIGAVAAQLAAAFINDPVMCWMWPVPQHRLIGMLRLFTVQLRLPPSARGRGELHCRH